MTPMGRAATTIGILASGRLWFLVATLAILLPWHQAREESFLRDEQAALETAKAEQGDVIGNYSGLENRIRNIRAKAARDTSWNNLTALALDDVQRVLDATDFPESQREAWKKALLNLRAGFEGRKLAQQISADSSRIRMLSNLIDAGRSQRRRLAWELIGSLLAAVVLTACYRDSGRSRRMSHLMLSFAAARLSGVRAWWQGGGGTWLGLNREQRAAVSLVGLVSIFVLVSLQWEGYNGSLSRRVEMAIPGVVVPAMLLAGVLVLIFAKPRRD